MLAQEPWCFHPEQIATLTDWQIEHLYARPAVERAKAIEAKTRGEPMQHETHDRADGQPPEPNSPEFRGWVIGQFMKMGMSRASAEAQFEEQAKQS